MYGELGRKQNGASAANEHGKSTKTALQQYARRNTLMSKLALSLPIQHTTSSLAVHACMTRHTAPWGLDHVRHATWLCKIVFFLAEKNTEHKTRENRTAQHKSIGTRKIAPCAEAISALVRTVLASQQTLLLFSSPKCTFSRTLVGWSTPGQGVASLGRTNFWVQAVIGRAVKKRGKGEGAAGSQTEDPARRRDENGGEKHVLETAKIPKPADDSRLVTAALSLALAPPVPWLISPRPRTYQRGIKEPVI